MSREGWASALVVLCGVPLFLWGMPDVVTWHTLVWLAGALWLGMGAQGVYADLDRRRRERG